MAVAGAAGLAWALVIGFGPALDPTHLTWLFQGDYVAYAFGWLFYKSAPWGLPLGLLPNLFAPDGTGVGFTDAIPWLAVLFKPLAAWLPESFHYFGWWSVACFVLQGVVGAWLGTRMLRDAWAGGLVGVLFVLSPPLASRIGHLALLGQFLVVAAVGLGVAALEEAKVSTRLTQAVALVVLAAGIHPYLLAMVAPLCLATVVRFAFVERRVPRNAGLGWLVAVPTSALATLWLLGYLSGPKDTQPAEGFGQFSADLLAFFNSWGQSRFFPALGGNGRQHEGFGYLGLGFAFVALATLVRLVKERPSRATVLGLVPTVVACLGLAFYALSDTVTVAGRPVAHLTALYAPFPGVTGALRTSGRFIWPLHALTLWVGVAALRAWLAKPWLLRGVLVAAVAFQLADVKPSHVETQKTLALDTITLKDPAWASSGTTYRHLALYPFHLQWICRYDATQVIRFGYEAQRRGLTFNSGLIGRVARDVPSRCDQHLSQFDAQTIYVATEPSFVMDLLRAGFACGVVDGYPVCVDPSRPSELAQAVLARPLK